MQLNCRQYNSPNKRLINEVVDLKNKGCRKKTFLSDIVDRCDSYVYHLRFKKALPRSAVSFSVTDSFNEFFVWILHFVDTVIRYTATLLNYIYKEGTYNSLPDFPNLICIFLSNSKILQRLRW